MRKAYYIVDDGMQAGPMDFEELLAVPLHSKTFVWTNGMKDWAPVSNRAELLLKLGTSEDPEESAAQQPTQSAQGTVRATSLDLGRLYLDSSPTLSTRLKRFLAFLIHTLFFFILTIYFTENFIGEALGFLSPALAAVVTYSLWSGNIAHKMMGMKVIKASDGSELNSPMLGFIRELIKAGSILMLGIPFLFIFFNKDRQTLHDLLVGTLVVEK